MGHMGSRILKLNNLIRSIPFRGILILFCLVCLSSEISVLLYFEIEAVTSSQRMKLVPMNKTVRAYSGKMQKPVEIINRNKEIYFFNISQRNLIINDRRKINELYYCLTHSSKSPPRSV